MRHSRQRISLSLFLALACLPLAGCGRVAEERFAARGESATSATKVFIDNFTYNPPEVTVAPGTVVTWLNRDDVPHTATSTTRPKVFDSGTLDSEQAFSHTFTDPGTYEYFCAVHPKMTGRIIVK
jgi:amicyanin